MNAEQNQQQPSDSKPLDIHRRVEISLAVQRYLRAVERFEEASREFSEACGVMREQLPRSSRLLANVNHQHHLVTCDSEGSFEVETLEAI